MHCAEDVSGVSKPRPPPPLPPNNSVHFHGQNQRNLAQFGHQAIRAACSSGHTKLPCVPPVVLWNCRRAVQATLLMKSLCFCVRFDAPSSLNPGRGGVPTPNFWVSTKIVLRHVPLTQNVTSAPVSNFGHRRSRALCLLYSLVCCSLRHHDLSHSARAVPRSFFVYSRRIMERAHRQLLQAFMARGILDAKQVKAQVKLACETHNCSYYLTLVYPIRFASSLVSLVQREH